MIISLMNSLIFSMLWSMMINCLSGFITLSLLVKKGVEVIEPQGLAQPTSDNNLPFRAPVLEHRHRCLNLLTCF